MTTSAPAAFGAGCGRSHRPEPSHSHGAGALQVNAARSCGKAASCV